MTGNLKIASALFSSTALFMMGCCASNDCEPVRMTRATPAKPAALTSDLPPNAAPGDCYTKVFVPAKTRTVTERICVRPASEKLETVPAQYEWVEERVLVKEASTRLEPIPAEFKTQDHSIVVKPGHTGWTVRPGDDCDAKGQKVSDTFCLVSQPPVYDTVQTQCLVKPATVREIAIPAEYTTVRRQKLVCPATTRKITIPAEYRTVERTEYVSSGRMEWQKVHCDSKQATGSGARESVLAAGPGPRK